LFRYLPHTLGTLLVHIILNIKVVFSGLHGYGTVPCIILCFGSVPVFTESGSGYSLLLNTDPDPDNICKRDLQTLQTWHLLTFSFVLRADFDLPGSEVDPGPDPKLLFNRSQMFL
jgi:hypothetical protein